MKRLRLRVTGLVQGVGFRPTVYRYASELALSGSVRNTSGGVVIEIEGDGETLDSFVHRLRTTPPPLARIDQLESESIPVTGTKGFAVVESSREAEGAALVSPETATCPDCLREMRDPADRRYRYPFINCTNCGPRFTIIEEVPYDRGRTTMRVFPLCPDCLREYRDPLNRRFHAEPNACPACGPRVRLLDRAGAPLAEHDEAVRIACARLAAGDILAIKGLGGFHIACDAGREEAVAALRKRKGRPHKPLAVMCPDLDTVKRYCVLSAAEERELTSPRRPILLLRLREPAGPGLAPLAPSLSPGIGDLGVMLPYTPLHHLLFAGSPFTCLVMTSGNFTEEPIVIDNRDAVEKLSVIADGFLVHDRPIWNRCDDSVAHVTDGPVVLRRSRGFAPLPVQLSADARPTLAVGAGMSNTFVLAAGRRAFLSQHIGEVDNQETLDFLRESIGKLRRWLGIDPEIVAHDLHPDLLTTHLAREMAQGRTLVPVQHHQAHLVSAMEAAGLRGEAQGLVLDGTGYGLDRTIWGGELLVGDAAGFRRAGHLRLLPLPGGDSGIRRPIRIAIAYLHLLVPEAVTLPLALWQRARAGEVETVRRMTDRSLHTVPTSSAGRLFDAVSSLLGVCDEISYEGQAAIELEQVARGAEGKDIPSLRFDLAADDGVWILDPRPLLSGLVEAILSGVDRAGLALAFHQALAHALADASARVRDAGGPARVVLCGGVFQNRILTRLTAGLLRSAGLDPVLPGAIPVNDGGIALGQVVVANAVSRDKG